MQPAHGHETISDYILYNNNDCEKHLWDKISVNFCEKFNCKKLTIQATPFPVMGVAYCWSINF